MALDPQYLDGIKGFEGYSPNAAWDYKQNSSGYGTKAQPGDEGIPPDQLKAVHEQRFNEEIAKAAAHVDSINPNLPPGVKAALTSLTYNAGPGWAKSGLGEAVKAGDLEAAQTIFPQYNKAGGEVNDGLVARRAKELAWWGGQPQGPPATPAGPPMGLLQQPAPPMGLLPPQAPSFPQTALGGGLQAATQQPGMFDQPQMQAPQIAYAQRRAPDLSKLRASLRPISFRG